MKWAPASGTQPRIRAEKVFVRYRCGLESKAAYPVKGQRWSHNHEDFDIVAYLVPEAREAA